MPREIEINPDALYQDGISLGLYLDLLKRKMPGEDERLLLVLGATRLLPPDLPDEVFNRIVCGFLEIIHHRSLKRSFGIENPIPEWDPEDQYLAKYHQACEIAFLLEAAELSLGEDLTDYLGPVYSLAGSLLEGIHFGADGDDSDFYENLKSKAETMLTGGDPVSFLESCNALMSGLKNLERDFIENWEQDVPLF